MKRFLSIILLCTALQAFSQDTIVGSISAGGQILSGNFKSYGVNAATDWRGHYLNNDWDIAPSFRYTLNSGVLRERELYATESYFYRFSQRFKLLVFAEQEHSWLRKTLFRGNLGLGVGYKFIHTKVLTIEASEAILPDFYFSLTNALRDNFAIRPSTRLKIRIETYPIKFETINMFQPEALGWQLMGHYDIINQGKNINFRSTTTLDVAIKKGFSVGARLDFIYQTYPHYVVATIQPYDLVCVFYLKYQFHDFIVARKDKQPVSH